MGSRLVFDRSDRWRYFEPNICFVENARLALVSQFTACLNAESCDDVCIWESKKVDQTYSAGLQKPTVIQNSGFAWCNVASKEPSNVSYKFIFYFGVSVQVA